MKGSFHPFSYHKGRRRRVLLRDIDSTYRWNLGCDALVHTASIVTFSPDPSTVIPGFVAFVENALSAAKKEPSIKRFVLTSLSAAAATNRLNEPDDLDDSCWNEQSVAAARAPPPYTLDRALAVYSASKVASEKALWNFIRKHTPHFIANAVLPDVTLGTTLNLEKQGYGPSVGAMKWLWDGQDGW